MDELYNELDVTEILKSIQHILSDYKKENELLRQQNISYKDDIHKLKKINDKLLQENKELKDENNFLQKLLQIYMD